MTLALRWGESVGTEEESGFIYFDACLLKTEGVYW